MKIQEKNWEFILNDKRVIVLWLYVRYEDKFLP